jgi:hypothetical protein
MLLLGSYFMLKCLIVLKRRCKVLLKQLLIGLLKWILCVIKKYENFTHKYISIMNILHSMVPCLQKEIQRKSWSQKHFQNRKHYIQLCRWFLREPQVDWGWRGFPTTKQQKLVVNLLIADCEIYSRVPLVEDHGCGIPPVYVYCMFVQFRS